MRWMTRLMLVLFVLLSCSLFAQQPPEIRYQSAILWNSLRTFISAKSRAWRWTRRDTSSSSRAATLPAPPMGRLRRDFWNGISVDVTCKSAAEKVA